MRDKNENYGLTKDEISRWETDLAYKKFSKDDLLGNAMYSFFTDKCGATVFEQVWVYLAMSGAKPAMDDQNWKMKFTKDSMNLVIQMKEISANT